MDQHCKAVLDRVSGGLWGVRGVRAVVLGGSHAVGTATKSSDIDVCVYYDAGEGLDIAGLNALAEALDDRGRRGLITNPGEWGPWINGGGWLTVGGVPVDVLLRELGRVESVMRDCLNGRITIDYQCGHPFGFVNSIYLGEVFYCEVLHEREDAVSRLKALTVPFPAAYRRAAAQKFLWEADFSLRCGRKAVDKKDVIYAAGSIYRAVNCLIQALYALNERYLINEKGSLENLLRGRAWMPERFAEDTRALFSRMDGDGLEACFAVMEGHLARIGAHARALIADDSIAAPV